MYTENNNSDYVNIKQEVTESLAWGRRGSLVSITYNEAEFGGLCVRESGESSTRLSSTNPINSLAATSSHQHVQFLMLCVSIGAA